MKLFKTRPKGKGNTMVERGPDLLISDLKTLDQIVDFCRTVQTKFGTLSHLQNERRKYQTALIDLCRRCQDKTCPEECEVKKAYRVTL